MKRLFSLVLILALALSLCGCIEGGETPSSDPASSAAELSDAEKAAYADYVSAVELRGSYLSAVSARSVTEDGKTLETVATLYTPYGLGTFFFDKVGKMDGKVVLSEHYEGSAIARNYAAVLGDIPAPVDASSATASVAYDRVAHNRVPLTPDFEYKKASPSSVTVTENGGNYEYVITFAEITEGRLLIEYGDKGAYTAKNVTVNAAVDDDEVLVYEKITATIVGGGAEKSVVITTEISSVNDVPSVPASTPLD